MRCTYIVICVGSDASEGRDRQGGEHSTQRAHQFVDAERVGDPAEEHRRQGAEQAGREAAQLHCDVVRVLIGAALELGTLMGFAQQLRGIDEIYDD
jgi:hypothetical protein